MPLNCQSDVIKMRYLATITYTFGNFPSIRMEIFGFQIPCRAVMRAIKPKMSHESQYPAAHVRFGNIAHV